MSILLFLLVISIVSCIAKIPITKGRSECDEWADEGDCVTNPSFMWSSCHTSCMTIAQDTDELCEIWAQDGECTKNPHHAHVHCPLSCQQAIGWSPWARQAAEIHDTMPYNEAYHNEFTACMNPVDLSGAASLMKSQISMVLEGGIRMATGFTMDAPNEYAGMIGLTEAIYYALRLYDLEAKIIVDKLSSIKNPSKSTISVLKATQKSNDKLRAGFKSMTTIIGASLTSDALMMNMAEWYKLVDEAHIKSTMLLNEYKKFFEADISKSSHACPAPKGPGLQHLAMMKPEIQMKKTAPVTPDIKLSNGFFMPAIALGSWQLEGPDFEDAVIESIRHGYRHIDTSNGYNNEPSIGWAMSTAIEKGLVARDEMFITTKMADGSPSGYEQAKRLVKSQLQSLKIDYIDLYMIEDPNMNDVKVRETWKALEEMVDEGKIRSLGVSNVKTTALSLLYATARIKPVVLQVKLDVYHIGKHIDPDGDHVIGYAKQHNMMVIGYSPFSGHPFVLKPIEDPIVKYIASNHNITPAQVLILWQLQHGTGIIIRTTNSQKLDENMDVLLHPPLSIQEMHMLDSLQYLVESPVNSPIPFHLDYQFESEL